MDTRLTYLLTLLPPLPPLGEQPPIALKDALALLRQQGGADLELLAGLLEAEPLLREALDEWVVSPPGARVAPAGLPPNLRALFDEGLVAARPEEVWVGSVDQAYLDHLAAVGASIHSDLLPRWSLWEGSLRRHLARLRGGVGEPGEEAPPGVETGIETVLDAWSATRAPREGASRLGAAMEAELTLNRARLAFLHGHSPRYSFAMDELVAYLLHLRLLERHLRLDGGRGRSLLREVAAL